MVKYICKDCRFETGIGGAYQHMNDVHDRYIPHGNPEVLKEFFFVEE